MSICKLMRYYGEFSPTLIVKGGKGANMGVHCACRPCEVHGMAHVPALDARSRVLRENVHGHCLPDRGCVGPTRTSVPLRGPAQFEIWPIMVRAE